MENIFAFVLTTSLYASIVGLIILLMKALLKNRLNAKWNYIVWAVLILKLLVPFGPESSFSLFNVIPEISYAAIATGDRYEQNQAGFPYIENSPSPTEEAMVQMEVKKPIDSLEGILPIAWMLGALIMLLWLAVSYLLLFKRLRSSVCAAEDRILKIYKTCRAKMKITREIPLAIQGAVSMPSIFGVLKPRILLSIEAAKLEDKELEYILLHELAHYKRKDVFVNYMLLMLQTLHWFNPVMWYCFKRIRQDMELATDEYVLTMLKDTEHKAYGRALLATIESLAAPKLAPKLLGMADDKKGIEKRLKMIKMSSFFKSRRRLVVLVGLLCVVTLSGVLLTNGVAKNDFVEPFDDSAFTVSTAPPKYAITMSSTPGIKITAAYTGTTAIKEVRYITEAGQLFTWDTSSGKVSYSKQSLDMPLGKSVYWSPLGGTFLEKSLKDFTVKVQLLGSKGQALAEREVKIHSDDGMNYTVTTASGDIPDIANQPEKPKTIEEAVAQAILSREKAYRDGEAAAEGHIILETEEQGSIIKVYAVASYGAFGFENGIFTKISGSGAIPTVITLSNEESNKYAILEYKEPLDGGLFGDSLKKMFPASLLKEVQNIQKEKYSELVIQQEEQAKEYLRRIGRTAVVRYKHVDKQLADINVDASNKLFSEISKYDEFINNCPYWLGTRELLEGGIRYIYETAQSKTDDGYDLITFTKGRVEGTIIKQVKYKIIDSEVRLVE